MLLHLYTEILPWDKISLEYGKNEKQCHSQLYDLKKNTNYQDFYKSKNKYDNHVKALICLYNTL
jgi:hypothetical protein